MQKLTVFHLISKHLFKNINSLCIFFMNYEQVGEVYFNIEVTIATEFW